MPLHDRRPPGARSLTRTTSSPRPSRSRSCPTNVAARHRFLGRSAAAGPAVLLPRHAEIAARHRRTSTRFPINAPKCPFQNFQRDGQMQTQVLKGRANYEPNSLAEAGEDGGPREMPDERASHSAGRVALEAIRRRSCACAPSASPTTTARRACSIARRPTIEQAHIASALVFELSKVGLEHVRRACWPICATSTRTSRSASPTGLAHATCRRRRRRRVSADRHEAVAGAVDRRQDESRRSQGRKVGILFADGSDKARDRPRDAGGRKRPAAGDADRAARSAASS